MSRKQIIALFICSLVPWTIGNGLVPLLPVYATRLGANPATAGNYLAFSYLALAIGALSAGWLSEKLHRHKIPLIVAGTIGVPIAWLMSHVSSVLNLTILTALLWLCGGLGLALIGILAGMSAGKEERGKIFGLLSLTAGLGALIGGLSSGYLVDHGGFPVMFRSVAAFLVLWPLSAIFLTEKETPKTQERIGARGKKAGLGRSFYMLFTSSLFASISSFIIILGRSILMDHIGFSALAISSTGAIGGLISMPLPLLMGWLSDRGNRKFFLYLSYFAGMVSLSLLSISISLWHFWIVLVLQSVYIEAIGSVGNALVADLVPPNLLGRGLSLFSATAWLGGVLGFSLAGLALKNVGVVPTLIIGIALTLVAVFLLVPIRTALKVSTEMAQ